MSRRSFIARFVVLLIFQLVLTRYCQIGSLVCISILPAMIFCIPTARSGVWTLTVAFLSGIIIDALADGSIGLNAAALLIVAAARKPVIRMLIDEDIVERNYSFSFRRNGFAKVSGALVACTVIFLAIYVILDSAGTRSFGFNTLKILTSSTVSFIFGLPVVDFLSPHQRR